MDSDIASGPDSAGGAAPGSGSALHRVPRLRTVLLVLALLVLSLPLGGISLLKLYDTMLIRQTESELIAQGAVLAAAFHHELMVESSRRGTERLRSLESSPPEGRGEFRPIPARLDLARDPVWPPAPEAAPSGPPDPVAAAAGSRLVEILEETQAITLAGLRVVDSNGIVVASSGAEAGLGLSHRREVASALEGVAISILRRRTPSDPERKNQAFEPSLSRRTAIRVVLALPVIADGEVAGAVVLARTPQSVGRALYENRWSLLPGALVVVLVAGMVASITARTLRRPLRALIDQTTRARRGEAGAVRPLDHPGLHEFRQISVAVSEMADEMEQRAEYIATFATNVSHELKTPLTSIRGTVELLRDHRDEMSAAEATRFLDMLEKDAERLERLVARLLELARADVLRPDGESVDLLSVLEPLVERFRATGFAVELCPSDVPDTRVWMAPEVLDSVFGNLVDNARQHGGEEARAEISIRSSGDFLAVSVADSGRGITAANRERIFDRFFTTAREHGRSGLGLAIVRALVEAHGGTISVRAREPGTERDTEMGTEVIVELPLERPADRRES